MSKREKIETEDASDEARLFRYLTEIGIINQLSSAAFQKVLPHGLTVAQFAVLNHCVRMGDDKTPAELAAILQVTRATLTSTLKRLESKAFIRLAPDAADGRSKRVLLTAAGRRAREQSIRASWPLLAQFKAALPRKEVDRRLPELEALRAWLDRNRNTGTHEER
ncbi:MAG: MarR family transcriptional regulator [Parvularculaceae bacterium]|nr:MarR family transcriptional regulator [Parvularculaceae bacterium]